MRYANQTKTAAACLVRWLKGWWFESRLQLSTYQSLCKNPILSEWVCVLNSNTLPIISSSNNVRYKRHGTRRRKRWACRMRMKTHWMRIWAVLCLFSLWVGVHTACVQSVSLCQSHTLPCLCHVCCPGSQFLYIYFLVFYTSCFLFSGCLCALLIASPTRLCLPFLHVWLAPPDSNALLLCPRSSSPVHYTFQNKAKYTQCRTHRA